MFQIRVVGSIPFLVINTVQDAHQRAVALAQQAIETAAHFFGRDFARIPRADGRDDVGVNNPRLQTAHLAVELHAARSEIVPGQVSQRVLGGRKKPLVSQVMDRQANPGCGLLPRQSRCSARCAAALEKKMNRSALSG